MLAYRTGRVDSDNRIVRVRKSELAADKSLVEFSREAISHGLDLKKTLETRPEAPRPADPHIEKKIQNKLMFAEIKRRIEAEKITFNSLAGLNLDLKSVNETAALYILQLITNQLKAQKLWRDDDKDLTMSEAFPLSQAKTDPRMRGEDLKVLEQGTFLAETDVTHEEASTGSVDVIFQTGALRLPGLVTPMLHNLMRASPRDLYHQIARRMIDSHFFEDQATYGHLFRACYLVSRGVEDERHYDVLMSGGLAERFPHYTFQSFQVERVQLRRLVRIFIERFFDEIPAVKRRLKQRREPEKRDPRNFWDRFFRVWDELTAKQQDALEKVYMAQEPLTRAQAAKAFGISVNSLDSRLKTAIQKFKHEFWELEGITPKRIPREKLTCSVAHGGLWHYKSAALIRKLFRVEINTGIRHEIEWRKIPKAKNLDWKTIARIKAEIIENCPVPHFHDTEYFDGMRPTIASFGRRPGNLAEDPDTKIDTTEAFSSD